VKQRFKLKRCIIKQGHNMQKIIILLLLLTLYSSTKTLNIKLSLAPHNDSLYGSWELKHIPSSQIDMLYKGRLIDNRNQEYALSPYKIEDSDIKIFQKKLYQERFLKKGYYTLEWIPKEGTIGEEIWAVSSSTKRFLKESNFFKNYHAQDGWEQFDWSMLLADYINSTIATLPTYLCHITNLSKRAIKIKEFYAKTIFTTGGEASPGGAYFPTQNKKNYFPLHWNHKKVLKLKKPIIIAPHKTKSIPLAILVKKGAIGDGPGRLTVAIFIKYIEGKKEKEALLTIISQSEDYGYQTGW
jgi:hypothetical protein